MSAFIQTDRGRINFSDEYVATMAGMEATECYGVVGMASKRATDGIVELLKGENLKKGVIVKTDGTDQIKIDLHIIVEYGISINATAINIIETVKYNLEKITGLKVLEINVIVNGIRV